MPLRVLSYRKVTQKLKKAGFKEVSQKGSHVKFTKETEEGIRTAIVSHHKEITIGTLKSILRQAGLAEEVFDAL